MSPRIEKIRDAVQAMHECTASHVQSVPVREMFRGQLVWEGVVEVFDLTGHPKAKRAYAWNVPEGPVVGVLEIPPVKDPLTAVRASIVAESKSRAPR